MIKILYLVKCKIVPLEIFLFNDLFLNLFSSGAKLRD